MNSLARIAIGAGILLAVLFYWRAGVSPDQKSAGINPPATGIGPSAPLAFPIRQGNARITKKPFGIFVSPEHSPVSPERFRGYHTGVDFETFADEKNMDVPVYAACQGSLILKKWAGGYGGVAVEACTLNGQPVTVVYGHLRLSSITETAGSKIFVGRQIGVLGNGSSSETVGERKHLHFGVHNGTAVDIRGYVWRPEDLSAWLDPAEYFSKAAN